MTDFFEKRLHEFGQKARQLQARDRQVATLRTVSFIIVLVLAVWLANEREASRLGLLLLVAAPAFIWLVQWHSRLAAERRHYEHLGQVNADELKRLRHDWKDLPADGATFADPAHPYTGDLDIFGRASAFQYLNRTATPMGAARLAAWLQQRATPTDLADRQAAVQALAPQVDWRQHFAAEGRAHAPEAGDLGRLWGWLDAPSAFPEPWLPRVALGLGTLTPLALVASLALQQYGWVAALLVAANLAVVRLTYRRVSALLEHTSTHLTTIRAAAGLLRRIEDEPLAAGHLPTVRASVLAAGGRPAASAAIGKLGDIITHIERRENAYFYVLFVLHTLWDLRWALRLERWKAQHRQDLRQWLGAVAELDALGSLAGLALAHPEFAWPTVAEAPFTFEATALGHPLIAPAKRVANDFAMTGPGVCHLITGSNMSGKSTFLRTVGLNAVLALAGAPVCAQRMVVGPVQVFTSMRTQDSLSESVSSFYAELRRIRALLDQAEAHHDTYYLLDEILKGTNSRDRHTGAKALVRQLQRLGVSGMVSTHDLELASLADEHPASIRNYHFASEVVAGQLHFPYQLRAGVCQSFNASLLMHQLGIGV
jgi:hypothetical protein